MLSDFKGYIKGANSLHLFSRKVAIGTKTLRCEETRATKGSQI